MFLFPNYFKYLDVNFVSSKLRKLEPQVLLEDVEALVLDPDVSYTCLRGGEVTGNGVVGLVVLGHVPTT